MKALVKDADLRSPARGSARQKRRNRAVRRSLMFGGALAAAGSSYFLTLGKPETYQHIVGGATFLICCGAILVDVVTTRGLEREGGIDALMSGGKLTTGLQSAAGRSWVQAEGAKLLDHESGASSFYEEALSQFRESEDKLGIAQVLVGRAELAMAKGNLAEAQNLYQQALNSLPEGKLQRERGTILQALGD